ncbi:MAG: creatininase family protein [Planctomycetota bacterium]
MARKREVRLEYMFAAEIARERKRLPLAFVPIAPLEWHAEHLPYGTDPLDALALCITLARNVGGVVHPPLWIGIDEYRKPAQTAAIGFDPREHRLLGMDFPANSVRSLYWNAAAMEAAVRGVVRALKRAGWRIVVLLNGHGAPSQQRLLMRVARTASTRAFRVLYAFDFVDSGKVRIDVGHADRFETSLLMHNFPDLVKLDRLPAQGKLRNVDHAIVDSETFLGRPTADFTVRPSRDPRRAVRAIGERLARTAELSISRRVREAARELGFFTER